MRLQPHLLINYKVVGGFGAGFYGQLILLGNLLTFLRASCGNGTRCLSTQKPRQFGRLLTQWHGLFGWKDTEEYMTRKDTEEYMTTSLWKTFSYG